ncbi:hypothetical protein B0F90DRAFT_1813572 [Multifurca ochricompacta]|uniref:Uncharacterized protein n=1 Tax=Multifurca ochricompacta TaxID=376703 RepID=A0AAD4MH30_9AGAM|nr:hypothetical protein B0F90DRAFT_1813572 [Multifurca ochricompacta]
MNPDVISLRAELKSFERFFKAQHGHAPSVNEIKKAGFGTTPTLYSIHIYGSSLPPSTADKYKLYKKLSKLGNATGALPDHPIESPSTPQRARPTISEPPIYIVPKSRAVKTESVSVSNPFSPVKNKQKEATSSSPSGLYGSTNPFVTPPKGAQAILSSHKALSLDPFPPIRALTDVTCPPPQKSIPNSTVSRARKRLRGEPVSPSPVKEKRQRIFTDIPAFSKLGELTVEDSDTDDHAAAEQANSSFVADSPMKPHPKGGAFKLLFEGGASDDITLDGRARSQGLPVNTGLGLLPSKSQRARSMSRSSDSETPSDNHQNLKMKSQKEILRKAARNIGQRSVYTPTALHSQAIRADRMEENSRAITTTKRLLADTESDTLDTLCPSHGPALIPPSPPPPGSNSAYARKGGARVNGSIRKRPKLPEDSVDEDEDNTDVHVKFREWSWQRRGISRATDTPGEDLDPILGLSAHDRPSSPDPTNVDMPDNFEVNLPDDLRRLLAISPSKGQTTRDVNVVRGVLYSERASNYDAQRGGDIWDVGEIGEASDSQAEDDWEGEPVPWETGDL